MKIYKILKNQHAEAMPLLTNTCELYQNLLQNTTLWDFVGMETSHS